MARIIILVRVTEEGFLFDSDSNSIVYILYIEVRIKRVKNDKRKGNLHISLECELNNKSSADMKIVGSFHNALANTPLFSGANPHEFFQCTTRLIQDVKT